ncbi:hypothetical protein KIN20_023359 [Parelaphostrongylus tenuis]|uniref:Uncharacterized protein n=1 Tax=Parelaphostrongylus tenuis TaxID=148309 RepID=A0AAD5N8Z6_PARTN|nr:hypothetical protein KIN20_023359 [Parelaphostrongylus tenuis]
MEFLDQTALPKTVIVIDHATIGINCKVLCHYEARRIIYGEPMAIIQVDKPGNFYPGENDQRVRDREPHRCREVYLDVGLQIEAGVQGQPS